MNHIQKHPLGTATPTDQEKQYETTANVEDVDVELGDPQKEKKALKSSKKTVSSKLKLFYLEFVGHFLTINWRHSHAIKDIVFQ